MRASVSLVPWDCSVYASAQAGMMAPSKIQVSGAEAVIETLADQEGSDIDRAAIDALDARDRALQCSQSRASARSWSSPM